MFTKILLPISIFIIIHVYLFALNIKESEDIITGNQPIKKYWAIMKNNRDVVVLMYILVIIYWMFGGILSLF